MLTLNKKSIYCSNFFSFLFLFLKAGNVGSSDEFLDHAVDDGKVDKWGGGCKEGGLTPV